MDDRPAGLPITEEDWQNTPPAVRAVVNYLIKRIEELEARINRDSSNSNQPPSLDNPFNKPKKQESDKKKKRKRGGQKGHKGHKQELLEPTFEEHVHTSQCTCGGIQFADKGSITPTRRSSFRKSTWKYATSSFTRSSACTA